MIYTINLAHLPAALTPDFLVWICENKIGNYLNLFWIIAQDETWYNRETIPFECSEKEATCIRLRWS